MSHADGPRAGGDATAGGKAHMLVVLKSSWSLLLGMLLLMLGNGLQGTLLGIRGGMEGYDAATLSLVMSGYYLGFLAGSYRAPALIRRVGHVRVFAALASVISAAFILYAEAPYPWVWTAMRVLVATASPGSTWWPRAG